MRADRMHACVYIARQAPRTMTFRSLLLGTTLLACPCLYAQADTANMLSALEVDTARSDEKDGSEVVYTYRTGPIDIADGIATLRLPEDLKFLDAAQSRQAIVEVWENPPSAAADVLGIVFRAGEDVNHHEFFFVVEYEAEGHVSDADADSIDYDTMLARMMRENRESDRQRKAEGYSGLELIGWASAPYYDKQRRTLHWALEMQAEGEEDHVLNYNIRVLGRRGVLFINAVSTMDRVEAVQEAIPAVLDMAQFNDGHRYDQFDPATDRWAEHTVGGLVDGRIKERIGAVIGVLRYIALGFLGLLVVAAVVVVAGVVLTGCAPA